MPGSIRNDWNNYLQGKSNSNVFNFSYLNTPIEQITNDKPQLNNYSSKLIIPNQHKNKNNLPPMMPPILRGGLTKKQRKTNKSHKKRNHKK